MSQSAYILDLGMEASQNLNTKQYYLVKLSGSGTPQGVEIGTSNTDVILGVLQNEPKETEAANVRVNGTSKVACGSPFAIGDILTCHTDGRARKAVTDKDWIIGISLETASTAGDQVEVLLTRCKASI